MYFTILKLFLQLKGTICATLTFCFLLENSLTDNEKIVNRGLSQNNNRPAWYHNIAIQNHGYY